MYTQRLSKCSGSAPKASRPTSLSSEMSHNKLRYVGQTKLLVIPLYHTSCPEWQPVECPKVCKDRMPINPSFPPSSQQYPHQDGYTSYQVLEIRLMRQISGFGFRIMGESEEGNQVSTGEEEF